MINLDKARQWLGRVDVRADQATPARLAALFATLDREDPAPEVGDAMPALGHWLYFVRPERRSDLSEDGSGCADVLPPVELPRRVWAESRIRFHRPLRVGDTISRASSILDISATRDPDGPVVAVLLRHDVGDADGIALSEDRRILFGDRSRPASIQKPQRIRTVPAWSRAFHADERTLFRYAALSFDARRIHYDRPYATFVEGHPGLVVQGGLVANLLLDLLRRHGPEAPLATCRFRAIRPLFDLGPFRLCGRPAAEHAVELWAEDAQGALAMEGWATLKPGPAGADPARNGSAGRHYER